MPFTHATMRSQTIYCHRPDIPRSALGNLLSGVTIPALTGGAWSFYIFHAGAAATEPASAGLPEGLTRPAVYGWGTKTNYFRARFSGLPVGYAWAGSFNGAALRPGMNATSGLRPAALHWRLI